MFGQESSQASKGHWETSIIIIIITTNQPVNAWGEILGDTTVAAAMLDRLRHRSVVLDLEGESYLCQPCAGAVPVSVRLAP